MSDSARKGGAVFEGEGQAAIRVGCNVQKALLFALLQPNDDLKAMQDAGNFTKLMVAQEELKTLPFGEVWDEYCGRCGKPVDGAWFPEIVRYEKEVLEARA